MLPINQIPFLGGGGIFFQQTDWMKLLRSKGGQQMDHIDDVLAIHFEAVIESYRGLVQRCFSVQLFQLPMNIFLHTCPEEHQVKIQQIQSHSRNINFCFCDIFLLSLNFLLKGKTESGCCSARAKASLTLALTCSFSALLPLWS